MWTVDFVSTYLYALKFIAIGLAVLLLISGVDDLIIDIVYWLRRAWRATIVYRAHDRLHYLALSAPAEKPLAIMVPAWHETGVIRRMAELAVTTLDYENYHIFVGTYPNDPDTQQDVDEVCARFRNVHKVVCARPGPTSKADCLNNVLDAILQFERRAKVQFAGFILHDAEDVISEMELRLFNYLVDRKDLIQLPVYPFERHWSDFTSAHYMDEFAELHGKDIPVREALAGQVPSAGVGTCFSRRAMASLLADGDGVAFDVQSLTEDYDIGFRLKTKGMTEIFVRFPVVKEANSAHRRPGSFGKSAREASVICVREYFPNTLAAAVRQKSRWIVGIVYQGFKTLRWTDEATLNYFLWRDRKGALTNFVSFLATLILMQWVLLWGYQMIAPHPYTFLSIFEGDRWLTLLLQVNLLLMTNRIGQRVFFVSNYYGLAEAVWSVPRLFWGNFINFLANCRALRQIVQHGDARRVAWDKTTHDFPTLGEEGRARRPLGRILVAQGVINEEQLMAALVRRARGLKLGSALVQDGVITSRQLAAAVAEQSGVPWEDADTLAIDRNVIEQLPADLAAHYAVLPLREKGRTLVLASEGELDPVSAAALARKLKRSIGYVIVPKGQVTVGLRYWYPQRQAEQPRHTLDEAVAAGTISPGKAAALWQEYVSRQVLFAEVLMSLGHLDRAALTAVLLRHDRASCSLGEYMVGLGMISAAAVEEALELQKRLQGSIDSLLKRDDVATSDADELKASIA
ncbi:MAG TPA: cyclic di-3',5'-guanylate-activated glycosyltransferase NrfB [Vicinamibacterales bacterium]|nr:cyclic di-3',5'-guanylate-activated glycosyltransferase NrfB [Vicinamibacterales bacterium]